MTSLNPRVLLLSLLLFAAALGAQNSSNPSWTGVSQDASGNPLSGATVRLTSETISVTAITDAHGQFRFANLPPSRYRLSIEWNGHRAVYAQPLDLPSSDQPVKLTLSGQTVSVESPPAPSGNAGGEQLSSRAVSELPLNKRDFSQLLLLAAGTMTDTNGATNFTQQFAINGQRGVEAVFAMDSADISDPEMGGATFSNFNVDAVQEIQSSSGWMPAEIGRGAAGFTNIITRSGNAGFHGSLFEFVRNSAFDARNFFDRRSIANPGTHSSVPPERIRLYEWWTGDYSGTVQRAGKNVLLRRISGLSASARHDASLPCAHFGGARKAWTPPHFQVTRCLFRSIRASRN